MSLFFIVRGCSPSGQTSYVHVHRRSPERVRTYIIAGLLHFSSLCSSVFSISYNTSVVRKSTMRTYSCLKLPVTKSCATTFLLYCDSHLAFSNCSFRGQKPLLTSQAGSNSDFPWSEVQWLLFPLRNSHLFGKYLLNIYCVRGTAP